MRNGGDRRGSTADRRRRKQWLLDAYGNGTTVRCTHCPTLLTVTTLEADRIIPGGSYERANILPSCGPCNKKRGNKPLDFNSTPWVKHTKEFQPHAA
jgi:hypothetical protein